MVTPIEWPSDYTPRLALWLHLEWSSGYHWPSGYTTHRDWPSGYTWSGPLAMPRLAIWLCL